MTSPKGPVVNVEPSLEKRIVLPVGISHPAAAQPLVRSVLQRTVAEAVPAPRNAIRPIVAMAGAWSI
jgi:hypothetical protein